MKRTNLKVLVVGLLLSTGVSITSCKSKPKETTEENTTVTTPEPAPAPVVISADDSLRTGITDATKDFPGVTATVNNGEITLTGEITRSRLPTLMQSLNSLRVKHL